jgi:hypothetical protein
MAIAVSCDGYHRHVVPVRRAWHHLQLQQRIGAGKQEDTHACWAAGWRRGG